MVSPGGPRDEGRFGEDVQLLAVLNILSVSPEEKPAGRAGPQGGGGAAGRPGSRQPALPMPSGVPFSREADGLL